MEFPFVFPVWRILEKPPWSEMARLVRRMPFLMRCHVPYIIDLWLSRHNVHETICRSNNKGVTFMSHTYSFPRRAIATDICIFTIDYTASDKGQLSLVLVERAEEPYGFALPGGFLLENENLDHCARRELKEETGIATDQIFHFSNFSEPNRDPREQDGYPLRVVSVAYFALLPFSDISLAAGSDARCANFRPIKWDQGKIKGLPRKMAFPDHRKIIKEGLGAIRGHPDRDHIVLNAMPKEFTLPDLHEAYRQIGIDHYKDNANFHRHIKITLINKKNGIRETGGFLNRKGYKGPPTKLYRALL
jgi:8-oxo-dGTP diphosphatase